MTSSTIFTPSTLVLVLLLFVQQQLSSGSVDAAAPQTLGVKYVQLVARKDEQLNLLLHVWLRRVQSGTGDGSAHTLRTQTPALRGVVWVEDLLQQNTSNRAGLALMPFKHDQYRPDIRIETAASAEALRAALYLGHMGRRDPSRGHLKGSSQMRPHSFRVDLPEEVWGTDCFKVYDSSWPYHKVSLCLPPDQAICAALAPSPRHTPAAPALWISTGPFRHQHATGLDWARDARREAAWLAHFTAYHVALGANGVMFYADDIRSAYLRQEPAVQPYLASGRLLVVEWTLPERNNIPYPIWDQPIVSAHTMLGLSGCGTNLLLMFTDVDEYLLPMPWGVRWPEAFRMCLAPALGVNASSGSYASDFNPQRQIAIYRIRRVEVQATSVPIEQEPAVWSSVSPAATAAANATVAAAAAAAAEGSSSSTGSSSAGDGSAGRSALLTDHPLAKYDLRARDLYEGMHAKPILVPATEIFAWSVHNGMAEHGDKYEVPHECMRILHVGNLHVGRHPRTGGRYDFIPFFNWVINATLAPPPPPP